MKLILFHPQLLKRTCARCRRWLFDERHQLVTREGRPVARPAGSATPCWQCPKQSPALAAGMERDLSRISRTLVRYLEVRATQGRCLGENEAKDPLLARRLAIVDAIVRTRDTNCRTSSKSAH